MDGQTGVVLITGAAGGVGKAFALECASRGWDLFLTDINDTLLPPLAQGIRRLYGVQVDHKPSDLTQIAQRNGFWTHLQDAGIRLKMLVNIAGFGLEGWFKDIPLDDLRRILRLNIEAGTEMMYRSLDFRLPEAPYAMINISSLGAFNPMPVKAIYAATKRYLLDMSIALHHELRPLGVNVTVVCPAGLPTTEMALAGIIRQGVLGQLTTVDVGTTAARTIDACLAGKAVYIPGAFNRVVRFVSGLLSPTAVSWLIMKRWSKTFSSGVQPNQSEREA